jgi:hypothetical protein
MRGSMRWRATLPLLAAAGLVLAPGGASESFAVPPKPTAAEAAASFDYTATASTGHAFVTGRELVPGSRQDDGVADLTLPFPVTFYGTTYDRGATLALGTNGNIQFPDGTNPPTDTADPGCTLPDGRFQGALFLYQGDLDLSADPDNGIYTKVQGTAPNRKLYVEWRGPDYDESVVNHFEAIFSEGSTRIGVRYGASWEQGFGEASGIQQAADGPATEFSCETATLTEGLQVDYDRHEVGPPPPPPPSPPPPPPPPPAHCVVPNAIGQLLPAAKRRIRKAHCRVGTVVFVHSARRLRNRVVGEKPRPRTRLRAAARVNLRIGRGR